MYENTDGEINKNGIKSRGAYNGGPWYCDKSILAETYATCVEQPIQQLMYAITAVTNLVYKGYDVGNAFAEVQAPNFEFFMQPDAQFQQWWTQHLKKNELLEPDDVIPIKHALQGHPEKPTLMGKIHHQNPC